VTTLFGYESDDIEAVRGAIERTLGVALSHRQTRYRSFYGAGMPGAEIFILQHNRDALDGELMEERHPQMRLLLYASDSDSRRAMGVERLLIDETGAHLLGRRDEG
jgi:hypothetical protein